MTIINIKIYIAFLLFIGLAWCHPTVGKKCHPRHSQPSQIATAISSTYDLLPSSIPSEKQEVTSSQVKNIEYPTQSYNIAPTPSTVSTSNSYSTLDATTATTSTTATSTTHIITKASTTSSSGPSKETKPIYPDVNTPRTAILAFGNGSNDGSKNVQSEALETLNTRKFAYYLALGAFIYYLL